jgi:Flp pilus assembly protein TadG
MPIASRSRRRQSGVAIIWYSLMLTTLMLPMMGIAVDLTILYTVQARMSAAVDGAALGAGRLLGTATGSSSAATEKMAGQFFLANFPAGYWSTPALASAGEDLSNGTPNTYGVSMTNPAPGSFRIQVTGNVRVPLIFARIFSVSSAAVGTSATATRRSSRIIYVLDRSGSMGSLWASLATQAIHYAGFASPGVDELGLVLFGTTGVVAYPAYTKPYTGYTEATSPIADPTGGGPVPSAGGPDKFFIDTVADVKRDGSAAGCTDMLCMIYQAISGGSTGMSEGLDLAYLELQKAHLRDLATDGADARMNTVMFFTDGVPNQIAVYANDPNALNLNSKPTWFMQACTDTWTATKNVKCKSNWSGNAAKCGDCTNCLAATTFAGATENRMVFLAGPQGSAGDGTLAGPYQPADIDINNSTVSWVKEANTGGSAATEVNYNRASGLSQSTAAQCQAQVGSTGANGTPWNAMVQIPKYDYYGTLTYPRLIGQDPTTPGYYNTSLPNATLPKVPWASSGTAVTQKTPVDYWGLAAWSATDNVGYLMRTDANQANRGDGTDPTDMNHHMPITIYTIGYTGNTGVDDALLRRLANDPTASGYVSNGTQQVGKYYSASDAAGIGAAMNDIMSSVLRLAQ